MEILNLQEKEWVSLGSACLNIKVDMNVLKNVNFNIFGNIKTLKNATIQLIL